MSTDQHQELGARVESARKNKGWYQKELAEAAGVSVNTVRALERGGSVSPGTIRKVLSALDIEPLAEVQARKGYPADVQLVLDLVGMYLVALPESDRSQVAYELTRFLMARGTRS